MAWKTKTLWFDGIKGLNQTFLIQKTNSEQLEMVLDHLNEVLVPYESPKKSYGARDYFLGT
jgi:hypothetical protein